MNELKDSIKCCEDATPLVFEQCFIDYQNLLNEKIKLEGKIFSEVLDLLLYWVQFFRENKISNPKILLTLLKKWDESDEEAEGVIGDLAATLACSQENLTYICDTLQDTIQILSILDLHIRTRYGTGMIFSFVVERLLKAFHLENLEDFQWEHLEDTVQETLQGFEYDPSFLSRQKYSVTRDNKDVIAYIQSKKKEQNQKEYAPIPKWVSLKDGETEEFYLKSDLGNIDKEKEKMVVDLKEIFTKHVNCSEKVPDEVIDMLKSLEDKVTDEDKHFPVKRYYGPVNEIIGRECSGVNGPCRMFYCVCREEKEDEDISYLDNVNPFEWFTGSCEECERKIRKLRYAVRFPVKGGGWAGCFCSFTCMKKSEIREIEEEDEHRMECIRQILLENGIFDI